VGVVKGAKSGVHLPFRVWRADSPVPVDVQKGALFL
jgi:hypothetical protein